MPRRFNDSSSAVDAEQQREPDPSPGDAMIATFL